MDKLFKKQTGLSSAACHKQKTSVICHAFNAVSAQLYWEKRCESLVLSALLNAFNSVKMADLPSESVGKKVWA